MQEGSAQTYVFTQRDIDRFLRHVDKQPGENGCWLWTGGQNIGGYGQFSLRGKGISATRFSLLALKNIELCRGYYAMHSCDTPQCVNPNHLSAGTPKQDGRDKVLRKRVLCGKEHHAQLHPETVWRGRRNRLGQLTDLDRTRFLAKIAVQEDGCWRWLAAITREGYGSFSFFGKVLGAHRASHMLFKGPILERLVVRHSCGNRWCVSPEHLSTGTPKQNSEDAKAAGTLGHKKTQAERLKISGELHCNAILKEAQVVKIIEALPYKGDFELAREYKVHYRTISAIREGKTWAYLPRHGYVYKPRVRKKSGELTATQRFEIATAKGIQAAHLAAMYGVHRNYIYAIQSEYRKAIAV